MDGTWTLQPPLLCDDAAQAPPPAAQAKSQPGVTSDTVIGGLVIHVMNNSDDTTNCHYDSEVVDRDFTLQPQEHRHQHHRKDRLLESSAYREIPDSFQLTHR